MTGYSKLFGSIITSTIWREDKETKILWITMLALKDKNGDVEGSVPGLADMARLTIEETEEALEKLRSPDPHSRTKENEGRRIEDVDGGWHVLNHQKYRDKMNADERREYLRIKQAEHREKKSTSVNKRKQKSTLSTHAEADAYTDTKEIKRKPLSLLGCVDYAKTIGISESDATAFFDSQESGGWTRAGKALKDWKAALRTWKANAWLPSQKQKPNAARPDFSRPKEKAPSYPPMTESREATEEEYALMRKIAAEEKEKLKLALMHEPK